MATAPNTAHVYDSKVAKAVVLVGSMAGVLNATAKHTVLPVFPRS